MNVIKDDSFGDVGRDVDCCCQALSIYQSLNLTLSLRDRDRADTIITLYHHHHHTIHQKLFKCLIGDLYSSVIHHWNRQLKPY